MTGASGICGDDPVRLSARLHASIDDVRHPFLQVRISREAQKNIQTPPCGQTRKWPFPGEQDT